MKLKTTLDIWSRQVLLLGQLWYHFRDPACIKSFHTLLSDENCGMWDSYKNYYINVTSNHGTRCPISILNRISHQPIRASNVDRNCDTNSSLFGLQKEAFFVQYQSRNRFNIRTSKKEPPGSPTWQNQGARCPRHRHGEKGLPLRPQTQVPVQNTSGTRAQAHADWRSMRINENQWESMRINENQWESMRINKNQWESMRIIEN